MTQMTIDQYKQLSSSNSKRKAKFSKYRAKPTTIDGYRFHSKKEAEYYKKLKDQQSKGEIARFHPQITFLLPGGIKHHVDFQVMFKHDNDMYRIEYHEVKGKDNPMGRLKRKQCEDLYGIEIKLI
jgi:hypothetical protein